jgi:hypothetical protein
VTDINRRYLRQWLPGWILPLAPNDTRRVIESGLRQFCQPPWLSRSHCFDEQIVGVAGFPAIDGSTAARPSAMADGIASGEGIDDGLRAEPDRPCFWDLEPERITIRCATGNLRSQAVVERCWVSRASECSTKRSG